MSEKKSIAAARGYDDLVGGISQTLEAGRRQAAWTLNSIISATYWEIGRQVVEFEQAGRQRADYGDRIIEQLSVDLGKRYGRGFGRSNLFQIRAFYLVYREKVQTVSGQFSPPSFDTLRKALPLPWSQYSRLLSVENPLAREFYEMEALRGGWSARQLDRQIATRFALRYGTTVGKVDKDNEPDGDEEDIDEY